MLERLADERVYFYSSNPKNNNSNNTIEVDWNLIRKVNKFPDYLMKGSKSLNIVTKDFTKYIDVDKQRNRFKIMDLYDGRLITYVPEDLMKLKKKSNPKHVINRFTFNNDDNGEGNTFRIVNEEGFEKIVRFGEEIVD